MIFDNLHNAFSNALNLDDTSNQFDDEIDVDGDGISDDWPIHVDDSEGQDTDDGLDIDDLNPGDESPPESDVTEATDIATVDIAGDLEHWHEQSYDDTCGIVAQEFILDEIGQDDGIDFSEDELRETASACGWYTPDGGTPMIQVGNLLEAYGIGVEKSFNNSLEDIDQQIQAGNKVLVALDSNEIWNPDGIDIDDLIANLYGMPGQEPNHTVQVVGINNSDPDNPLVILNDPGIPEGRGLTVPADDFLNAWEDSNNFMVATSNRNLDPNATQFAVNSSSDMNNILLGSIAEGDNQTYWGNSYQKDADWAEDWAESYNNAGNTDKALEFEKQAAEAREKAKEHYDNAQEEYRKV